MIKEHAMRTVRDYHERSKHRPDRFAPSLGYMDWDNQPDPFRSFAGSEQIELLRPPLRVTPLYDELFARKTAAADLNAELIGRLFYHSLALSAWKQAPNIRPWSLRINPSSGALYPTEGYLISGPLPGLCAHAGVFHYVPLQHRLERRCRLSMRQWSQLSQGLPSPCLFIGLTSIYWRESWKYGERAFRYCHHDVGHAIGALAFCARTLGWEARVLDTIASADLDRLLGTHLQTGPEAEHGDCFLVLYPAEADPAKPSIVEISPDEWHQRVPEGDFTGQPNRLSRAHHPWPAIEDVSLATRKTPGDESARPSSPGHPSSASQGTIPARNHPAEQIIRQRRSAVGMDGTTWLDGEVFFNMLQRTRPEHFPFRALPWQPRISLAVFVHRIRDLAPGLYLFARSSAHETSLRRALPSGFEWRRPDGCPGDMRLFGLISEDMRPTAKMISCYQGIAADGAFSLGMLAAFDTALADGKAWIYPRLFWECGLIGQLLYLEAEAAGIQATGIGCFFDDAMHELLGITGNAWQSLYHFTVGGAVTDNRIRTIPPYAHLAGKQQ